jgi:hypothetical protein
MTVSGDQMGRALEPGSIEYGKKEQLVQQLGQLGGGGRRPPGPARPQAGVPAGGGGDDDFFSLLAGGEVAPPEGMPVTDGLSVGPGAGPAVPAATSVPSAMEDRLRLVALNARSPMLRAMARNALRRQVTRRLYGRG